MKQRHIFTLLLALTLTFGVRAQNHEYVADTAVRVVDAFLQMQNADAMPRDSMLFLRTSIVESKAGQHDTFEMLRWYQWPNMMRVEVWHKGDLQGGLCTNGSDRYRLFRAERETWIEVLSTNFYEALRGYDFRGALYNWRAMGATLHYKGRVRATGDHLLENVMVEMPGMFDRYYMFEPSGLLAVIIETDNIDLNEYKDLPQLRIEWKCIHEYMAVGPMLLPKQESYMRDGRLTVMETEAELKPRENLLFNIDNRTR